MTDNKVQAQMNNRSKVFICYSHKDAKFLLELSPHLHLLAKNHKIDIWSDRNIQPGSNWRDDVKHALDAARVAILLVSIDFLTSQFITEYELPALLQAAGQGQMKILPVYVRPVDDLGELAQFQFINDLSKPLSTMKKAEREKIWARATKKAAEIFQDERLASGDAIQSKMIERISKFTGSTIGTFNHGLGVTPDEVLFHVSSGNQRIWCENVTATQMYVVMESITLFTAYAIKYF